MPIKHVVITVFSSHFHALAEILLSKNADLFDQMIEILSLRTILLT